VSKGFLKMRKLEAKKGKGRSESKADLKNDFEGVELLDTGPSADCSSKKFIFFLVLLLWF
jgi:hypothetical protein